MKRLLCVFAALLSAFFSSTSFAAGNFCGEGVSFTLSDGVLEIYGEGEVSFAPWESGEIREIVVREGVSAIGARIFENCAAEKLTIPSSLKYIGENAFSGCVFGEVLYGGSGKMLTDAEICPGNEALTDSEGFLFTYEYESYTVEEVYRECAAQYPQFIANVKAGDARGRVTDEAIIVFLGSVYDYLKAMEENLDLGEFNSDAFDAVMYALNLRKNIYVKNALSVAYPGALDDAEQGVVSEELMPIFRSVRRSAIYHSLLKFTPGLRYVETVCSGENAEITFKTKNIDISDTNVITAVVFTSEGEAAGVCRKNIDTLSERQSIVLDLRGGDSVKLFILDDFQSLRPLGEAYVVRLRD